MPVVFASGSNRVGDIRGFSAIGHGVGVAAPELSANAEAELVALAGTGIPVFVDSGAFSEVEFGVYGAEVVHPIDDAGWVSRLDLYDRLARALGEQVYVVAPDRIGDQEHTLALLVRCADRLAELAALGARILVPIQKGLRTLAEFRADVFAVLPFEFVPALPCKKSATTLAELREFVLEVRPRAIHLLGMGATNKDAKQALAAIEEAVPGCDVSRDSNRIAAVVGRGEHRPHRPLTQARDMAGALIAAGLTTATTRQELGIVMTFGTQADFAKLLRRG